MLSPRCKITFTKDNGDSYVFDFATEFETEESYENLTDTFKLSFPRALNLKGVPLFTGNNAVFQRGDRIKVEAGYFPQIRTIFEGWVASVGAKIPVEIVCEDDMFLLKNTRINFPDKSLINYRTDISF